MENSTFTYIKLGKQIIKNEIVKIKRKIPLSKLFHYCNMVKKQVCFKFFILVKKILN